MIGFIIGLSFSFNVFLVAFVIYLHKKPHKTPQEEMTEEEKRKHKEIAEHYDKILNYSSSQAYGRID